MEITVFVTKVEGNGYRATSSTVVPISIDAPTRDEAVEGAFAAARAALAEGELVRRDIPPAHPFAEFAGMFKEDPLFDEWQECIAEYRARKDAEEGEGRP